LGAGRRGFEQGRREGAKTFPLNAEKHGVYRRKRRKQSGGGKRNTACQSAQDGRTSLPMFLKPIQIPSDGGKKVDVLGIPMVIRIHGRDTGGVVSAVESHDVPGSGPPPHIHHREDETFQVLEGEYEWMVGGSTFIAQKGSGAP